MSASFSDKVVLVTGAAKGIGAAVTGAFASAGAAVGAMDVDEVALSRTVDDLDTATGTVLAIPGDVRSADDARRVVARTVEAFGGLDVLVNNAGVARLGPIEKFSEDDWDLVFAVNVKGQFQMCRFALPHLVDRGGGAVVNLSSVQAFWSQSESFAYSASKAASVAFTRALSLDYARHGVRVNGIAPGSVRTPMLVSEAERLAPEDPAGALEGWGRSHPIGRLIEPSEIAEMVLFLASGEAGAVSGATVLADGGLSAGVTGW